MDFRAISYNSEIECMLFSFTSIKCRVTRKLVTIYKVIIVGIISSSRNVFLLLSYCHRMSRIDRQYQNLYLGHLHIHSHI